MEEEKKTLRRTVAQRKAAYSCEQRRILSARLLKQLELHPRFKAARTLLLYYSLSDEVFTHEFAERWRQEKTILLPVVKEGGTLELHHYTGKSGLRKGAFGIEEPSGPLFADYPAIDVAIVPGVSFDKSGNRLGRGKGYYDRLLPKLSSYNIGICYAFQVSEKIPCGQYDRKMDAVLTDEGWLCER